MRWFGFGFNAFGQINVSEKLEKGERSDAEAEVIVVGPAELLPAPGDRQDSSLRTVSHISACWSRTASLHLNGKSTTKLL